MLTEPPAGFNTNPSGNFITDSWLLLLYPFCLRRIDMLGNDMIFYCGFPFWFPSAASTLSHSQKTLGIPLDLRRVSRPSLPTDVCEGAPLLVKSPPLSSSAMLSIWHITEHTYSLLHSKEEKAVITLKMQPIWEPALLLNQVSSDPLLTFWNRRTLAISYQIDKMHLWRNASGSDTQQTDLQGRHGQQ